MLRANNISDPFLGPQCGMPPLYLGHPKIEGPRFRDSFGVSDFAFNFRLDSRVWGFSKH